GCILELVPYVTSHIRHVPAHAQRLQRTQNSARVEFPAMIGVIQVAMRGKIVVGNHCPLLLSGPDGTLGIGPIVCCCGKRVKGRIPWAQMTSRSVPRSLRNIAILPLPCDGEMQKWWFVGVSSAGYYIDRQ